MLILLLFLITLLVSLVLLLYIRTARAAQRLAQEQITPLADPTAIDLERAGAALADVVNCPTISLTGPNDPNHVHFQELKKRLEKRYPLIHSQLEKREIPEENLLFIWQGSQSDAEPILICAHMDVVPADVERWLHEPFGATVADGYVWGRGSFDMKGQLITIFEAVEHLLASNYTPQRSIWLAFGSDEEIRGSHGARAIVQHLQQEEVHFAFTLDEGGVIYEDFIPNMRTSMALIGVTEKQYLDLKLSCREQGGHSSSPNNPTPLGRVGKAIGRLESRKIALQMTPVVSELLKSVALSLPKSLGWLAYHNRLFAPLLLNLLAKQNTSRALISNTMAATMAQGSQAANVISPDSWAVVNTRLLPGFTTEMMIAQVRKIINDPSIEIEVLKESPPSKVSSLEAFGYDLVRQAVLSTADELSVAPYIMVGGTDGLWYEEVSTAVYRFTPFLMNSGELARMHGIDERLSLENLRRGIHFYQELIKRL